MHIKHLALGIFVMFIWGVNFSVIKLGVSQMEPFLLAAFRFLFAALPMVFFVKKPNVSMSVLIVYGICFGVGIWGLVNVAIDIGLSAGIASLVLQFSPFFTVIAGFLYFKEKLNTKQLIGIFIAACGLLTLLLIKKGNISMLGIVFVLLAALFWSICNVIVKKHQPKEMLSFVIWANVFAAITLFALTAILKGGAPFLAISFSFTLAFSILFQAYVSTILGYWLWNYLMVQYPMSKVAPLSLLVPVFGLSASAIFYNETINAVKIIATVLILTGLYFLLWANKKT